MIWIAIQSAFGFECIIHDSLHSMCEKAGISEDEVCGKYVDGMKCEVWNGEKRWVVERVSFDRLQIVINEHLDMRRKIKFIS